MTIEKRPDILATVYVLAARAAADVLISAVKGGDLYVEDWVNAAWLEHHKEDMQYVRKGTFANESIADIAARAKLPSGALDPDYHDALRHHVRRILEGCPGVTVKDGCEE